MFANEELLNVKKAIENGEVIAFPTETVMGLGVAFDNFGAYTLLNNIKRRPEDKPYTMMLGRIDEICKYAYIGDREMKVINAFMPGPITVLVKAKENIPGYVTHNTGIIGIRVPGMPEICEMINYIGKPLLVPSANRSGELPCKTYREVKDTFGSEIKAYISSDAQGLKPSTLVDLTTENIKIFREGPISLKEIEEVIK